MAAAAAPSASMNKYADLESISKLTKNPVTIHQSADSLISPQLPTLAKVYVCCFDIPSF